MRQTGTALGIRHFLPAFFLCGLAGLGALSFFSIAARIVLGLLLTIYLVAGAYFSLRAPRTVSWSVKALMPLSFLVFHLTYGLGVIVGLRFAFRTPDAVPIRP
jgi:hypothetical protein